MATNVIHATESVKQYIQKKGIAYFLNEPTAEDVAGFKNVLFDENGKPILSNIYFFAGISERHRHIFF